MCSKFRLLPSLQDRFAEGERERRAGWGCDELLGCSVQEAWQHSRKTASQSQPLGCVSTGCSQQVVLGWWLIWGAEGASHASASTVSRMGPEKIMGIRNQSDLSLSLLKKYPVHAGEIRSYRHAFKDVPTVILADETQQIPTSKNSVWCERCF